MVRSNFSESRDRDLITNDKPKLVLDTPIKSSLHGERRVSLVGPCESGIRSGNMNKVISIIPVLEIRQRTVNRRILTTILMSTNYNIEILDERP